MRKKLALMIAMLLGIVVVIITIVNKSTFAQSFFTPTLSSKPQTLPSSEPPTSGKAVLSPNEFKNAVNILGQENMNKLSQEASKEMPKIAAPPPVVIPPGSVTSTETPPITTTPEREPETSITPPTVSEQTMPETQTQVVTPTSPTSQQPTVIAPSAPKKTEIYTGFGAGAKPPGETSKQPAPSSTGGWNIKY